MVYKKYIKRNGKLYGPYTYHSRRVNGKVISEYRGASNNFNYKNVFVFVFGILALILLAFFFFNLNGKITGYALSEPNINLSNETMIYPVIYFTLISKQSIEIPAEIEEKPEENEELPRENPELVINESDINKTIIEIPENATEEFFNETAENEELPIEPEEIINNSVEETINEENATQEITEDEEESIEEETQETIPEQLEEPAETPSDEEIPAPITGNIISKLFNSISNFFLGIVVTGKTISESTVEIYGETSFDNPFVYQLKEGETIQLVPGSVKTDSKYLDDNIIKIIYQGNEVLITTNYSESAENISIGNLTNQSQLINQSQEIINPISFDVTPLSNEEKEFILATFGNVSIQTISSKLHNDRYEIEYQFGDYNIQYSYDAKISTESLALEMEKDRIRWIRNIINQLSEEETTPETAPQFILNYSLE
ncbi:hypothetical protein M0R19_01235 [Candidatus Pacearchaeota archaeon]|nr:hypothetical protein [Candidatus Pacearchaeota archaeon]